MSDDLASKIAELRLQRKRAEAQKRQPNKQTSGMTARSVEFSRLLRSIEANLNAAAKNHFPEIEWLMNTSIGGKSGGRYELYLSGGSSNQDTRFGLSMSVSIVALTKSPRTDVIRVDDRWRIHKYARSYDDWEWSTESVNSMSDIFQIYDNRGLNNEFHEHQQQCCDSATPLLNNDEIARRVQDWIELNQRVVDWKRTQRR